MSIIHLNHIKGELDRNAVDLVDQSDLESLSEKDRIDNTLSRALALFTLKAFTGEKYDEISSSITDGFHDYGIDCLHWDRANSCFYLIQSKWIKSAKGGPKKDELLKFFEGVRKLLLFDLEGFDEKIVAKKDDINEAFMNYEVKVKLVLGHTGTNVSPECQKLIDKTIADLNDQDEVIFFEEFNLKDAHRALTLGVEGNPIDAEIDIS